MKRITMLLGGALIAAGLSVYALAQHASHQHADEEKLVTIQGELIDAGCYVASDGESKGQEHAQCAQECMASGIPAGILPEGSTKPEDLMYLLTNSTVLAPYAAQTIKVEGVAKPAMHAIDVKKLYVKDGTNWKEVQLKDAHHKAEGAPEHGGHSGHSDQPHGHK